MVLGVGATGAQAGEQTMSARFLAIVKQLPWEAGSDTLDEFALYSISWAKCSDGCSGVGQSQTSGQLSS